MLDINYYQHKGHVFGECMSHPNSDLMYVNIPKNASSWTKPNLLDWSWENYNYHTDNLYHKHAMVVLRDPVDRWLSGIAEYLYLYHRNIPNGEFSQGFIDVIFDRVAFDDHTERQSYFIQGIDTSNCTFFWFDDDYRTNFSRYLAEHSMPNKYNRYAKQHVSDLEPVRKNFKEIFKNLINDSKYLYQIKDYFKDDYDLINSVKYYK
jgi:hypothetical protein